MKMSKANALAKTVTIHQPDFMPWLGFFDRWRVSDLFIVLDDVQFIRRGWHHRDKIKTPSGVQWLTVPVRKRGRNRQLINEVELDNEGDWRRRHLETIRHAYHSAPEFREVFAALEEIYARPHRLLIDHNLDLLRFAAARLGVDTPLEFSSNIGSDSAGTQRLVDLVKAVGGRVYVTGTGSREYLEESLFASADLEVRWQEFQHPVYRQLYGDFVPKLSILDYLMMNP